LNLVHNIQDNITVYCFCICIQGVELDTVSTWLNLCRFECSELVRCGGGHARLQPS